MSVANSINRFRFRYGNPRRMQHAEFCNQVALMQTRITIIDEFETVSFAAPVYLSKMVAAACSRSARTLRELLTELGAFDPEWSARLLARIDADNNTDLATEHGPVEDAGDDWRLVRVVDDESRQESLLAVEGGLVLFNLTAKRIIQVSVASNPISREGRGRLRRNGRSVSVYYSYALPADWSIVP